MTSTRPFRGQVALPLGAPPICVPASIPPGTLCLIRRHCQYRTGPSPDESVPRPLFDSTLLPSPGELKWSSQRRMPNQEPAESLLGGKYRILDRLGGGGLGDVYRGESVITGRP